MRSAITEVVDNVYANVDVLLSAFFGNPDCRAKHSVANRTRIAVIFGYSVGWLSLSCTCSVLSLREREFSGCTRDGCK